MRLFTSLPTSSTMPIGSCPKMSPAPMNALSVSYRCRSEPQRLVVVIRTIASVCRWIFGSGTVSTRTSRLPCQVTALMPHLNSLSGMNVCARWVLNAPDDTPAVDTCQLDRKAHACHPRQRWDQRPQHSDPPPTDHPGLADGVFGGRLLQPVGFLDLDVVVVAPRGARCPSSIPGRARRRRARV